MSVRRWGAAAAAVTLVPLTFAPAAAGAAPERAATSAPRPVILPAQWPRLVDEPGMVRDRIVITRVAGVRWEIWREPVTIPAGQATVSLPIAEVGPGTDPSFAFANAKAVHAFAVDGGPVTAPGAQTTAGAPDQPGVPEWWLHRFRGAGVTSATAQVTTGAYPRTLPPAATSQVSFSSFAGARGQTLGDLQFRTVTLGAAGVTESPWRHVAFPGIESGRSLPFSGTPGVTYEFRAKVADQEDRSVGSVVTPWSTPSPLALPLDANGRTGVARTGMTAVLDPNAYGGTLMRSTRSGGSWTSRPRYGSEVALAFGLGPQGSHAEVYIDGARRATVSTYDPRVRSRQLKLLVRGLDPAVQHSVKVVNRPRVSGRSVLSLDALVVAAR